MTSKAMVNRFVAFTLGCALASVVGATRAQPTYGNPKDPVAGKVLGTVVHTRDAEELRYVVLRRLTDRYAAQQGIRVTPAEVRAYALHVELTLARDRERYFARRDKLARELAAPGLPDPRRQALASELESTNKAIEALAPSRRTEDAADARAREEIAAAFVRQWKINRALFRQYGGRVVFQQGGPEPLDAYRLFLEEHQRRGDFEIVDKGLEAEFWHYYRTDSIHSFYRPGSPEEARVFTDPPWSEAPAAPDQGGARSWEVTGTSRGLNQREEPSLQARIVGGFAPGAILNNLGCKMVEGNAWCDVQALHGGPRGWVSATYLKPAVSPDGSVRTGPDDSALRAGQGRFDATGTLPCAQSRGQPMAPCEFGVARAGGGYATVVVTRPDGRKRAIFFQMGEATGADTSQADGYPPFHATRKADLQLIRIGGERYEIVDAIVLGG